MARRRIEHKSTALKERSGNLVGVAGYYTLGWTEIFRHFSDSSALALVILLLLELTGRSVNVSYRKTRMFENTKYLKYPLKPGELRPVPLIAERPFLVL